MQFRIEFTYSWTVKQAGSFKSGWRFDTNQGVWWLDISLIERYLSKALADFASGDSVSCFILGFELSDSAAGFTFEETSSYTSYRPKTKTLISVAQLDWPAVKNLDPKEQFAAFRVALLESVFRISIMKREPRGFLHEQLYSIINQALTCTDGLEFSVRVDS
jgi:hypothetical protein